MSTTETAIDLNTAIRPELHGFILEFEKYVSVCDKENGKKNSWKFKQNYEHMDQLRTLYRGEYLTNAMEDGVKNKIIREAVRIAYRAFAAADCYID